MNENGVFCEIYGNTISNRVLEYLLENQDLDFAVGDMAGELGISRPKAYEIIRDFEKKEYVKKSRIIGKTQLYLLNKKNKRVKLFLKNFKECLKIVVKEYGEKSDCNSKDKNKSDATEEKEILARVYLDGVDIAQLWEAV